MVEPRGHVQPFFVVMQKVEYVQDVNVSNLAYQKELMGDRGIYMPRNEAFEELALATFRQFLDKSLEMASEKVNMNH